MKLGIIVASAILLAAGLIALLNGNWEVAVFCIFIGLALGLFFLRGG